MFEKKTSLILHFFRFGERQTPATPLTGVHRTVPKPSGDGSQLNDVTWRDGKLSISLVAPKPTKKQTPIGSKNAPKASQARRPLASPPSSPTGSLPTEASRQRPFPSPATWRCLSRTSPAKLLVKLASPSQVRDGYLDLLSSNQDATFHHIPEVWGFHHAKITNHLKGMGQNLARKLSRTDPALQMRGTGPPFDLVALGPGHPPVAPVLPGLSGVDFGDRLTQLHALGELLSATVWAHQNTRQKAAPQTGSRICERILQRESACLGWKRALL